ncbi:glycosyltransferase family 2 protein [Hazenella sp. IB182353]|uniref:glycosyltransferase n=1 Tax=Polycladospora coralii TaxID=2771432 RepID=UPI0017468D77|nr:glycosyltransferase family A protein [Polycladospora coralii]MBS7530096.1 glycosyltransferase family 2 protein [Polycladospora coralii]
MTKTKNFEGISIICPSNKDHMISNILQNYSRQQYALKELIIVLNSDEMDEEHWRKSAAQHNDIKVYRLPGHFSLGACLNFAVDKSNFPFIARFDDDDYYSFNYLQSSLEILLKTKADVVGRQHFYMYIADLKTLHTRYTDNHLIGGSLFYHKNVFSKVRFADITNGEDIVFYNDCKKHHFNIQEPSHLKDFVYVRNSQNFHHTWKPVHDDELYYDTKYIAHTDSFLPYLDSTPIEKR